MARIIPFWLALFAIVVSATNPPGFMVSSGAEGVSIKICSGTNRSAAVISRDDPLYATYVLLYGDQSPPDKGDDQPNKCAFAGSVGTGVLPDLPTVALAPWTGKNWTFSGLPPLSVRSPRANPPSTGPPVQT